MWDRCSRLSIAALCVAALACLSVDSARAYNFWQQYAGRKGRHDYYDLAGEEWDDGALGPLGNLQFTWSVTFPSEQPFTDPDVKKAWVAAIKGGIQDWAKYLNITEDYLGEGAVGLLRYEVGNAASACHPSVDTDSDNDVDYAPITLQKDRPEFWSSTSQPVPSMIRFVASHETGHALGLDDLYDSWYSDRNEEFVDHPVAGGPAPNRDAASRWDNLMQGGMIPLDGRPDRAEPWMRRKTIDNDEIAGGTWLWGGDYHQVVTANMGAWDAARDNREPAEHHGHIVPHEGMWTYRGSIVEAGSDPAVLEIEFPGYMGIVDQWSWPNGPTWIEDGADPNNPDIRRFKLSQTGWTGNFELALESTYENERRVRAWIHSGRTDKFILPTSQHRLVFESDDSWPVVFGPMGYDDHKDYGDAPASYRTLFVDDGPRYMEDLDDFGRHYQCLGKRWDKEPDGQPTLMANGDDLNLWGYGGPDDEDGVLFGDSWVDVTVTSHRVGESDYLLRAWWDMNKNWYFDHDSEMKIDSTVILAAAGSYTFHYDLGFDPKLYYSRFRLTWIDDPDGWLEWETAQETKDIKPWYEYISLNDGHSHGEVEDYPPIPEPATVALLAAGTLLLVRRRRRG